MPCKHWNCWAARLAFTVSQHPKSSMLRWGCCNHQPRSCLDGRHSEADASRGWRFWFQVASEVSWTGFVPWQPGGKHSEAIWWNGHTGIQCSAPMKHPWSGSDSERRKRHVKTVFSSFSSGLAWGIQHVPSQCADVARIQHVPHDVWSTWWRDSIEETKRFHMMGSDSEQSIKSGRFRVPQTRFAKHPRPLNLGFRGGPDNM